MMTKSQNKISMLQRCWVPYSVTWPSCDNHTTMCLAGHIISRPGTWGSQPPFLFPAISISNCIDIAFLGCFPHGIGWKEHSGCGTHMSIHGYHNMLVLSISDNSQNEYPTVESTCPGQNSVDIAFLACFSHRIGWTEHSRCGKHMSGHG